MKQKTAVIHSFTADMEYQMGEIKVESKEHKGSEFVIHLPINNQ